MKINRGFTLIELLLVFAIIGILGSVILAEVQIVREKAKVSKAEAHLKQIEQAILVLANETQEWPGHLPVGVVDAGAANNEVWDLSTPDAGLLQGGGGFVGWNGPYVNQAPVDPWGNNYFFDTDYDIGTTSTVWAAVVGSFGPNGNGQNVYDSDNIIRILAQ